MADMQEMALAVPSCDFVIVISNVSNLFNSSQKEFFKKNPGDTALADVMAPGVMAATYGLVWTLVLADITKGLATNRYHSIYTSSI